MSSKSCMIRFGIRFSEIGFEKFINYGQSSQISAKIKKRTITSKINKLPLIKYKKLMKKLAEILLVIVFFPLLLIWAIFLILPVSNLCSFFCNLLCVFSFYLEGLGFHEVNFSLNGCN